MGLAIYNNSEKQKNLNVMKQKDVGIIKKIIWLRLAQILVNNRYKNGDFIIPIHLAMGHESIAVAVDETMQEKDGLFLTHRNIHYNLYF